MNRYRKLSADTALFAISNFSSKLLVFLLLPLYTSYLQTEEYGTADLLNNITNILFPILTLSLIEGVLRFSFDEGVKRGDVLGISLLSVAGSVVILLAATPVAWLIGGVAWQYWWQLVLIFSGYCLTTTLSYYLRGINCVKWVAIQGVLQTALTVACNILMLVCLKKGLNGYLFSMIFAYFATAVVVFFGAGVFREVGKMSLNRGLLKDMLRYCVPMIPSKVAWWANNSLDKYFIIGFAGMGASGLYSVAHKIPSVLTVVTEIFNQAWQLSAIEAYQNKDGDNTFYSTIHQYYIFFAVVCAAGLILLSELLGSILFAQEFFVAWRFVPPLVVAAVFSSLSGYYHSIFRAAKMSKELCVTVVCGTAVNFGLNFVLVPAFGAMGAAYATMIAFAAEWVVSYIYCQRVIKLKIQIWKVVSVFAVLVAESAVMLVPSVWRYPAALGAVVVILLIVRGELWSIFKKLLEKVTKRGR